MRSNKILEHTADVRLQVEGDSLEELFTAAFEGMANIIIEGMCGNATATAHKEDQIIISSPDTTTLLIDFLSEVLTKSHINQALYCLVTFEELTETSLKAIVTGHSVTNFDEDIKAVTYHEANIQKNDKGNYETIIIFDI